MKIRWNIISGIAFASAFLLPATWSQSDLLVAEPSVAQKVSQESKVIKEMIVLTVDKTALRAELKTLPENGETPQPIRSFQIAIGKAQGDKEKQGDNKTPEGIYFTVGKIDGSKIPFQKYGPVALPLNFPNAMDQLQGKTGHGIWLHGVGERKVEDANITEGCVAFPNNEITSLVPWLKPSHGVVVISNSAGDVNRPEDLSSVYRASQTWIERWAARDLDAYIDFYADDFDHSGKDRDAFKKYKRAVFNRYKEMSVKMDNIRIVTHPKYALVMMNQDFNGDNIFKSDGRKLLYWRKDDAGRWKIVREMFDDFLMNPVQFTSEDIVRLN